MNFSIKFSSLFVFLAGFVAVNSFAEELTISLTKPPPSIQKWYKPDNKRQVWLHTMFRLRREMLAISDYSQLKQTPETQVLTTKWLNSFKKDYLEITKMVPEWEKLVDTKLLEQLELAINNKHYSDIPVILNQLENSCESCHVDYQAITRLMYRSADFTKIKISSVANKQSVSYAKHMEGLSKTVNRLKIAIHDNFYSKAIDYIDPLQRQLSDLSESCGTCHNYPSTEQPKKQIDYIFASSQKTLNDIKQDLEQKQNKKARRRLGGFAVNVCAKCHSAHKTTADLKELIE
jgi:hypothetical protein